MTSSKKDGVWSRTEVFRLSHIVKIVVQTADSLIYRGRLEIFYQIGAIFAHITGGDSGI